LFPWWLRFIWDYLKLIWLRGVACLALAFSSVGCSGVDLKLARIYKNSKHSKQNRLIGIQCFEIGYLRYITGEDGSPIIPYVYSPVSVVLIHVFADVAKRESPSHIAKELSHNNIKNL